MEEKSITVDKLQQKLANHEPVFVLDVRPADQRQEWQIAGSTHIDAYKRLKAGDLSVLDAVDIPPDTTVVTVCAAGKTSQIASAALSDRGIQAYSLHGGMKAWNYAWNTAEIALPGGVRVIQVRRPAKGVLSYVVGSLDEAVVIDASLNPEVYLDIAKAHGWSIKYAMDTHIHADYVSRTGALSKASGAAHLLIDNAMVDFHFTPISDGGLVKFGDTALQVIHTPGHTWESTAYTLGDQAIFTGDTLFVDGVGRPDLKAERAEAVEKAKSLFHSLKKILSRSPSALVLPAHTAKPVSFDHKPVVATIGEISQSVRLTNMREREFVEYAISKIPPTPPNYETISALNRSGIYETTELADLEAGGNHCAVV